MTVTYSNQISTTSFCLFSRLLLRWRGSVFKLIWKDIILYLSLYAICSASYRFLMDDEQKRIFEKVALVCESFRNAAPISFILGFYVSIVVSRWWEQYMLIPWPDDLCILVASFIQGQSQRSIVLRRGVVRYVNLAFVLTFSRISSRVTKAFPNYDRLVGTEYLTPKEKKIMEMIDELNNHHEVWDPLPLLWASLTVVKARKEGFIPDDHSQEAIIHEITKLRYSCSKLQEYSNMSVPLVYTQVTTMATYSYFLCSILGRQFLDPEQGYKDHLIDLYVPVFTLLQFIFYMGWLKVAESLLNPFGDDDDDFDTNELLERHLEVSYMIVDNMHRMQPHLLRDLGAEQRTNQNHHNHQNPGQHKANNCNQYQNSYSLLPDPTESILNNTKEYNIPNNYHRAARPATRTVEIDPQCQTFHQSSQESFCSVLTAVPVTSEPFTCLDNSDLYSGSSSDCSYESCFSLGKQNSRRNSKVDGSLPSGFHRRRSGAGLGNTDTNTYEKVRLSTLIH